MKDFRKKLAIIIIGIALSFSVQNIYADTPPDPGGGGPGSGDVPVGGGAPISGGLFMLVTLGAAYAFKKTYRSQSIEKQ